MDRNHEPGQHQRRRARLERPTFPTRTSPGTSLATICAQDRACRCYAGCGKQDGLALIHGYESGSATLPACIAWTSPGATMRSTSRRRTSRETGDCAHQRERRDRLRRRSGAPSAPVLERDLQRRSHEHVATRVATLDRGDDASGHRARFDGAASRFSIAWRRSAGGSFTCFPGGTVARPYVANGKSGPVEYLSLQAYDNDGSLLPNGYSIPKEAVMQPFAFMVTVGLRPPLQQSTLARRASPHPLRDRGRSEPDPVDRLRRRQLHVSGAIRRDAEGPAEIAHGCVTPYAENETLDCSDYSFGDLPPRSRLRAGDAPDCAPVEERQGRRQLRQGISARFEDPCTPNNWPDPPITPEKIDALVENFDTDPRFVTLIVTEFGAFTRHGQHDRPGQVLRRLLRHRLGLDGNNPRVPRQRAASAGTRPDTDNEPHLDDGDLWGYFVNVGGFSASGKRERRALRLRRAPNLHRGARRVTTTRRSASVAAARASRARQSRRRRGSDRGA